MELHQLILFIVAGLLLNLTPGPDVLYIVTNSLRSGAKAGVIAGLGITAGCFVHIFAAALGVSALLAASATAFTVIKLVGAAYLIYLGVRALLEKPSDPSLPQVSPVTPLKAYLQAIPAEVLNPKTALFFLAFMPQFVHPERGSTFVQFAVLGLIFVVLVVFLRNGIACSIRPLGRIVKRLTWLTRWQGKIIGSIFIALGLRVAVQQR